MFSAQKYSIPLTKKNLTVVFNFYDLFFFTKVAFALQIIEIVCCSIKCFLEEDEMRRK